MAVSAPYQVQLHLGLGEQISCLFHGVGISRIQRQRSKSTQTQLANT
jgi:hypothetical protein